MKALLVLGVLAGTAFADPKDSAKGFQVYPGSRPLCAEHVSGNKMHILWTSHATRDAMRAVIAHYEKATGKKAAKADHQGLRIDVDRDRHINVYPATSESKLPACNTKTSASEKTIVVMSTAMR